MSLTESDAGQDPFNPENIEQVSGDAPPGGGVDGPDALFGLRSTEPPVTPGEIGQFLDIEAKWHEHLFCGFIKQSSSDGAEAWMHYVMAAMILAQTYLDSRDVPDPEPEPDDSPDPVEGDGPELYNGPQ